MSSQPFKLNSKLVQAGAGAGKTTALSDHVFTSIKDYFKANKKYPHFIVCTFTVKATQELRERLVKKAYDSGDQKLLDVIKDPSLVNISTIHGLLNHLLRKYALDFGLQPDFQLQDELTEERYRRKLTRAIFIDNDRLQKTLEIFSFKEINEILYKLFLIKLNNHELKPIELNDLNSLYSEYRDNLILRIKKIITLTVGVEALAEFTAYLSALTSDLSSIKKIDDIKFPRFSKKLNLDESAWNEVKSLREFLKENCHKSFLDLKFWTDNINLFSALEEIFVIYFDAMINRKILDTKICLSEIEGLSNYLLSKNKSVPLKVQEQIDYWYIDEFQDTSPVQLHVLEKLIGKNERYIVGDPQQSIYLFRGAEVSLFDKMRDDFKSKDKDLEIKNINYRSDSPLLAVINDIFTPLGFLEMKPFIDKPKACVSELLFHNDGQSFEQIFGLIKDIKAGGSALSSIAILVKTNDELSQVQRFLLSKKIPVLVSASGGLFENRIVKDLLYFLLALSNPYNNEVLLTALRNPVWGLREEDIHNIFVDKKTDSVWTDIEDHIEQSPNISLFLDYYKKIQTESFSQVLQNFIITFNILDLSFGLDGSGLTYANVLKFQQILKEQEKNVSFHIIRFAKYCLGFYSPYDEVEAVSPVIDDHVQLMTVHKSKGLQFDHVILPFMHKSFKGSQFKSIVFDDSFSRWSLALPYGDENTKQHNIFGISSCQRDEEKKLEEYVRLFYVAVTRAIKKVYFVGEEKLGKNSWFSYLPTDFVEATEHSTANYISKHSYYETEGVFEAKGDNRKTINKASDILKPGRRFSVSQILSSNISSNFKTDTKTSLLAEHIGTKTHSILERYRFHKDLKSEAIDYLLEQTKFPFAQLMSSAHVEWGFTYKVGNYLMEGKVDLWGIVDGELWIVDYKTGSDLYKDKAFSQLQYYSLPIRKFTGINSAKLVVTYPFGKKTYIMDAGVEDVLIGQIKTNLADWQTKNESLIQSL